jgi:BMFP domain-containing protein YqiC/GTP-binding protein EngB required for normal cell division
MADIIERKQKLFGVIDGYAALLDRWGDASRKADLISERKAVQRRRYYIALIGFIQRGKSTLLNALLGDEKNPTIAPARNESCTAAIVKYFDSALYPEAPGREGSIIYFNDGRNPAYIEKDDVSRYVDQQNKSFAKGEAERIDCIEIYGNFPLVERQGVIVDTPGRGALYDLDYLTTRILPEADVIISPIAADYPLDKSETDFFTSLPDREKRKLLFVLTKTDDVDSDELDETIEDVQNRISAIIGGSPRLFKTAALKVVKARQQGKTSAEVESIKSGCGIKELETALDEKLRTCSSLDEQIRALCNTLGNYFTVDKNRLTENKEALSLGVAELEQKKKVLELFCQITKTNFEKNKETFRRKWAAEVARCTAQFKAKGGDISDRLTTAMDREFLPIGFSTKMARKIESVVGQEVQADLSNLNSRFEGCVALFTQNLTSDIDHDVAIHCGTFAQRTTLIDDMHILIGGSITAGSVVAAGSVVSTAMAAIGAAATATPVLFSSIGTFFLGSGTVSAGAVAGSSIVPVLGAAALAVCAVKIGSDIIQNKSANKISKMVKNQIYKMSKDIENNARKMLEGILTRVEADINAMLAQKQQALDSIMESLRTLNKEAKLREIEMDLQEISKLSTALNGVS